MLLEHVGLTIEERGDIAFRFRSLEPLRYILAGLPEPSDEPRSVHQLTNRGGALASG
jgi:hypothetical protein